MKIMLRSLRVAGVIMALSGGLASSGRGQTTPAATPSVPRPTAGSPAALADWLVVDSAARIARVSLEVTAPPNAPSVLINGFRSGGARVTVPVGWTVQWDWRNADHSSPHSLVVMVQREKIPLEGGRPSFTNAMTRMVTEGLAPGQNDRTTFEAEEAGWFWILCGVPGHALKGEWIELRVDPEAKTATAQIKSVNSNR